MMMGRRLQAKQRGIDATLQRSSWPCTSFRPRILVFLWAWAHFGFAPSSSLVARVARQDSFGQKKAPAILHATSCLGTPPLVFRLNEQA